MSAKLSNNMNSAGDEHEAEAKTISGMLEQLSEKEKEIAARTSYRYLVRRLTSNPTDNQDWKQEQEQHARNMARRYLQSKKDSKVALAKMKETIAFREAFGMDALRLCFNKIPLPYISEKDQQRVNNFQEKLQKTMPQKEVFVQGFDREGRALWIAVPRNTRSFEPEAFIRDAIYALERAIACSEANKQDKVTAILDYDGYHPVHHNPPLNLSRRVLQTLRNHYVGRLHRICLVNAPWSMRTLWNILKPFAGRETRQKLVFVANDPKEKERLLGSMVSPDQALKWMLPSASKEHRPFHVERFLKDIPFDQPYTPAP